PGRIRALHSFPTRRSSDLREIGVSLDQLNVTQRLRDIAASEERIRLARDLHDGVLQSLTGIRLELRATAATLSTDPDGVRGRLLDRKSTRLNSSHRTISYA